MSAPTSRSLRVAERLYRAAILAYPRAFRHVYGDAMTQAFRDRCRTAAHQHGGAGLRRVCAAELRDLVATAAREHGDEIRSLSRHHERSITVVADTRAHTIPPRLWAALVATALAFVVSLLASLNLYLLEDDSPLTQAAYSAAPLLRFSYDGVYLSALVAGVAVCAIAGYAVTRSEAAVLLGLAVLALLVALGGFGGLLIRHPATFLALFLVFDGLILVGVLAGRAVATRMRSHLGQQPAALLGACVSANVALLVNLLLLVPHTIALNPVSHSLYMQGQIGGTRLNSLLIAMAIELLTVSVCALSIGAALRGTSRPRGDGDGNAPLLQ